MSFQKKLTSLIDWFYWKPFQKMMPKQTFRYLICGLINFVVTIACYSVAYNFIFDKENFDLGFVVLSPHVAALGISLPLNMIIGFLLQKNISFKNSPLKNKSQILRYLMTALVALVLNYFFTKLFVDVCHIYPTVAQILIYVITAIFSFVAQKYFAFRGAEKG